MLSALKEGICSSDSNSDDTITTITHIIIFSVLIILVITSSMRLCIFNSKNNKLRNVNLEEKEAFFNQTV
jgi:hypothetical protein